MNPLGASSLDSNGAEHSPPRAKYLVESYLFLNIPYQLELFASALAAITQYTKQRESSAGDT